MTARAESEMKIPYDKYYLTKNYFGNPYPELIDFFAQLPAKGKVLDLGCGQGRNAIPLAQMGFEVTGIDISKTGINQMCAIAKEAALNLTGKVSDIYEYSDLSGFQFILLDSMFHFTKKDKQKEMGLIRNIIEKISPGSFIIFCIQNTGNKADILNASINHLTKIIEKDFYYHFKDQESQHTSVSAYKMIVVKK